MFTQNVAKVALSTSTSRYAHPILFVPIAFPIPISPYRRQNLSAARGN